MGSSSVVPLFDSLTHPTLSGRWFGRDLDARFASLVDELDRHGIVGACAVGLEGIEGYDHEPFIEACRAHAQLVPIAGYASRSSTISEELTRVAALGFRGIKLHPRFSRLDLADPRLAETFVEAGRHGLVVFWCTYHHAALDDYTRMDPFMATVELLRQAPQTRVVLVHGGDVQLLRYSQLVRHNPRLLLDLSHTMLAYEGSSLDADIRFLFERRDRRICVGSDHPEFRPGDLRRRFDALANGLARDALENIGHANLQRFLSCD